jgi:hypothetical protein
VEQLVGILGRIFVRKDRFGSQLSEKIMKCTNPIKCNGEMKPLQGWPKFTECEKCGFRIPTPAAPKPAPKVEPVVATNPEENK